MIIYCHLSMMVVCWDFDQFEIPFCIDYPVEHISIGNYHSINYRYSMIFWLEVVLVVVEPDGRILGIVAIDDVHRVDYHP